MCLDIGLADVKLASSKKGGLMRWMILAATLAGLLLTGCEDGKDQPFADSNKRSLEAAEQIRKQYEAQELKTYGRILTPEERQQKMQAALLDKPRAASSRTCQPTFPVPNLGDVVRIEPGQEERFAYPPGLYVVQGTPGLCSLVVSDQEAKDGDKWLAARRQSYAEWEGKRKQIHSAVLRSPVAGPKKCPAPLQKFGPGSFIMGTSANLQKQLNVGPGWYVVDINCKPIFAGPATVAERGQRLEDTIRRDAEEKKSMQRWASIAVPALGILFVLLIIHFVTKKFTNYGLLAWLLGKAKRR